MEDIKVASVAPGTRISESSVPDVHHEEEHARAHVVHQQPAAGELDRYISLKPIVSFGLTLQASWESTAISFQTALLNGGPVSLVYGIIFATIGSTALAASLGEMASMDPVVGAQYRWSTRYAPRLFSPRFWGFMQGWLTLIAWIFGAALTPYVLGTIVEALIIFNNPDYTPQRWHGTLLMWAFVLVPLLLNIYARKLLSTLEVIGGVCHLLFFICVMVVLIALAPRSPNEFVWKTLINSAPGWSNPGAAFCIGLLSPTFVVSGFDGVLHMSDEVKDAPRRIPQSMILTVVINGVFSFGFIVALLYCIGDVATVAASPTGLPIIEVFYIATGSTAGTNVLVFMILTISFIGGFSILASVSRLTWAFARDRGLPFSTYFSYVDPKLKIPTRALYLVSVLCCLLALINLGSTSAFFAVLSLTTLALYLSYLPPILFLLLRKLEGRHPKYGPFSLGRWGIPINIFALVYGVFIIIWLPFPTILPVTKDSMNYAAPVWIGCFTLALIDWFVSGRKRIRIKGESPTEESSSGDEKQATTTVPNL